MNSKVKSDGYSVSKCQALALFLFFVSSLVAVGLLIHFLAGPAHPQASNGSLPSNSSSPPSSHTSEVKPPRNVRLPRHVLPRHYDIKLLPIIEKGNFSILGDIAIDLECKQETDRIILHSADIVVDDTSVKVFYLFRLYFFIFLNRCNILVSSNLFFSGKGGGGLG